MSQITPDLFDTLMRRSFGGALEGAEALAVGVSGGGDSMALLSLMAQWCSERGVVLHALSVDHGLRAEARQECQAVSEYCEDFSNVKHATLVWDAPKQERVQEEARRARYDLMSSYCEAHELSHLFLAHHEEDQAETVLFRLAKGSGLDGLSGMRAQHNLDSLTLCRPLLQVSKDALIALCIEHKIPHFDDPSNDDGRFARVRLRQSMDVLRGEGLTSKRLSVTALRISRARDALNEIAIKAYANNTLIKNTDRIVLDCSLLSDHEEIVLRCVQMAMVEIGLEKEYAPRMEKVEALVHDLKNDLSFRKRTLGGVIFERRDDENVLVLMRENL